MTEQTPSLLLLTPPPTLLRKNYELDGTDMLWSLLFFLSPLNIVRGAVLLASSFTCSTGSAVIRMDRLLKESAYIFLSAGPLFFFVDNDHWSIPKHLEKRERKKSSGRLSSCLSGSLWMCPSLAVLCRSRINGECDWVSIFTRAAVSSSYRTTNEPCRTVSMTNSFVIKLPIKLQSSLFNSIQASNVAGQLYNRLRVHNQLKAGIFIINSYIYTRRQAKHQVIRTGRKKRQHPWWMDPFLCLLFLPLGKSWTSSI